MKNNKRVILMFPYSGYKKNTDRQKFFWDMVKLCYKELKVPPVVILNEDTIRHKEKRAEAFLADVDDSELPKVDIQKVWSVDTCQMWLSGWGYVINNLKEEEKENFRIILLPGDIDTVFNRTDFFHKLKDFINLESDPIIIGDFTSADLSSERFNAKDLIDQYGTYALLANWFPEILKAIMGLGLNKPRSEFLNIRADVLQNLLVECRKFAYEQTLNMLIRSWDFKKATWTYEPHTLQLGSLKDDGSFRQYKDCMDQIERTERMLKLLWRDLKELELNLLSNSDYQSAYEEFMDQYDKLDRRSTSIRDSARIIIRNLLEACQMEVKGPK